MLFKGLVDKHLKDSLVTDDVESDEHETESLERITMVEVENRL